MFPYLKQGTPVFLAGGGAEIRGQAPGHVFDVPYDPVLNMSVLTPELVAMTATATQASGATTVEAVMANPYLGLLEIVAIRIDFLPHPEQRGLAEASVLIQWAAASVNTLRVIALAGSEIVASSPLEYANMSFLLSAKARQSSYVYAHFAVRGGIGKTVYDRAMLNGYVGVDEDPTSDLRVRVSVTGLGDNAPNTGLTIMVNPITVSSPLFEQYMVDMYGKEC
jgi:hypothetical protein